MADYTFKFKRGRAASWLIWDGILQDGEPGFETDTGQLKIGYGGKPWAELPYVGKTENFVYADTKSKFPIPGDVKNIYKAGDSNVIYVWDPKGQQYVDSSGGSTLDIELINGGNANG